MLKRSVALAAAVLAAFALAFSPAGASQGVIVGVGVGSVGPCGGHVIQFTGVNPAADFWTFTFGEAGGSSVSCFSANGGSVTGTWTFPSGCVNSVVGVGDFCLNLNGAGTGTISVGAGTGTVSQACGAISGFGCVDGPAFVTWARVAVAQL